MRDDHGPHEPLIFPNLVIATYFSDGIKAYSMANPLMPVEIGTFINQNRACHSGGLRT